MASHDEGRKRKKKKKRKKKTVAPAANRTRGPSMATMDFTTKPLAPHGVDITFNA
ncbi:hypothetical protein QR685DRAFT_432247 [Neurospora intermedia]|uniref:Uncharacterized protein n=1 Tax=Neurospora intermedia TaxID=5142 RepID=A0ABR3DPA2_NEUIN